MRAWLIDGTNGIDKLRLGEVADPIAGAGEVVLRVELAGLNPADRYMAEGAYPAKPPMPHILGRDGMGVIEAVGADAGGRQVGQKALILRGVVGVDRAGTFAQRVSVPIESLVSLPGGWSEEQCAGAPLVYLTAYQALTQWGQLGPGVVLVSGASGGVGVATIQLAKAMGHVAVGLSRDANKAQKLREIGADQVFDPRNANWPQELKSALGGRRVDLAIDNIGGEGFNAMLESLGPNGRISCVGRLAGPVPQFNTASLFFRRIRIGGVAVGSYLPHQSQAAWTEILALMEKRGARPLVDSVFGFEELPKAFARLKEGPMGKVLLRVSD
jgi:NADPH2:quinone reductase